MSAGVRSSRRAAPAQPRCHRREALTGAPKILSNPTWRETSSRPIDRGDLPYQYAKLHNFSTGALDGTLDDLGRRFARKTRKAAPAP